MKQSPAGYFFNGGAEKKFEPLENFIYIAKSFI